jgi:peptidoglycan/LPS O-acetylase OafA/YrhL
VAFPVLVHLASRYQSEGLLARLSAWLGRVSYAVYILHMPILYLVLLFVIPPVSEPGMVNAVWIATVVAVVAAAYLIDRVYDAPVRRALAGRSQRSAPLADRAASF